jgi:hypothetical protein
MPAKKDDEKNRESRFVGIERDEWGNQTVTPKPLSDMEPTEDEDGNVILSEAVRQEQEDEGYVPDIQPKACPPAMTPITGVTGTAPGGVGAMQPTGNVVVANAASVSDQVAIESVSPVPGAIDVEGGAELPKDKQLKGDNPATAETKDKK